jgi:hypothetical protein
VSDTFTAGRRTLDETTEFKVTGRRGAWFAFVAHVVNPDAPGGPAEWIDATDAVGFHSFRPSRITQIRKKRVKP